MVKDTHHDENSKFYLLNLHGMLSCIKRVHVYRSYIGIDAFKRTVIVVYVYVAKTC